MTQPPAIPSKACMACMAFMTLCALSAFSRAAAIDGQHIKLGSDLVSGWVPEKPTLHGALV